MTDRSPWAPPTPPTRSLAWPAPEPTPAAIVPGSIVRSRFGSGRKMRVTDAGPSMLKYRLLDDEEAGDFTMYPEHAEHVPSRAKAAITSAIKNAGNQAGHWKGRLGVLWHQQTQPKVQVNDRRTGHSAACNAKRGNRPGGPGFIRTAGCPGCAKLGKKPAKGKGKR